MVDTSSLLDKLQTELEMLESIYSEDQVIHEAATLSEKHPLDSVECTFKLQPNTGFNMAKVAVIVLAKFTFKATVKYQNQRNNERHQTVPVQYPFDPPTFEFTHVKGLDDDQIEEIRQGISAE